MHYKKIINNKIRCLKAHFYLLTRADDTLEYFIVHNILVIFSAHESIIKS